MFSQLLIPVHIHVPYVITHKIYLNAVLLKLYCCITHTCLALKSDTKISSEPD